MVTNSYHDNQDIPNMQDADTALSLFQQQQAGLAHIEEIADQTLEDIGKKLGQTLKFGEEKGLTKLVERTQLAWQHAQQLNRQVHHLTSANKGAVSAMTALQQQRDALAAEHLRLVDAIDKGVEDHPQLRNYADGIRNDAYELMQEDMEEGALEYAFEIADEQFADTLVNSFGINYRVAALAVNILQGYDDPNEEQAAALAAFFATLEDQG